MSLNEIRPAITPADDVVLIDEAEVGRLLSVHPKTVARRRVPGRIKLGRLVRYNRAAVLAWVAAGCPTPEPSQGS